MKGFIEITRRTDKAKEFINVSHIVSVCKRGQEGCDIFVGNNANYPTPCSEIYGEIKAKIEEAME